MKYSKWMICFVIASLMLFQASCASTQTRKLENQVYLFWTPNNPKMLEPIGKMNQLLNGKCGGFSRWVIDGGWRDPETKKDLSLPGYFYMVSCKSTPPSEIANMIKELFQSKEVYLLEMPAYRFKGE